MRVLVNSYDFFVQCEKNGAPKCSTAEGPAGWATSFEKLLEDPLGLHKFAVSEEENDNWNFQPKFVWCAVKDLTENDWFSAEYCLEHRVPIHNTY